MENWRKREREREFKYAHCGLKIVGANKMNAFACAFTEKKWKIGGKERERENSNTRIVV